MPELALDLGLVTLAVGIGWLAVWLFNRSSHLWSEQAVTDVALVGTDHQWVIAGGARHPWVVVGGDACLE